MSESQDKPAKPQPGDAPVNAGDATPSLPIPGSVKLAVLLTILATIAVVTFVIVVFLDGIQSPENLVLCVAGFPMAYGMAKGRRIARQFGRIVIGFYAAFYTFYGGLTVVALTAPGENSRGDDSAAYRFLVYALVMCLLLWPTFLALGKTSAKEFFRLLCPNCQADSAKPGDIAFHKTKCGECGHVW